MENNYLLLIDGSSLLSTQFFGSLPKQILFAKTDEEKERYFNKILQTSDGFYTNGVYGFVKYLLKIIKEQRPSHLAIAWDISRNTFRREMYPDYKGNRGKTMAPLSDQFAICEKVCDAFGIPQFMSTEYEADDFCGTLSARFEDEIPVFIMTKDNDYLQLVDDKTKLWLMHSTVEKTDELYKKYGIDKSKVNAPDRCFVYDHDLIRKEFGVDAENVNSLKGIMGDASDNIKGVPGVGPATAAALIGYYHTVDAVYAELNGKSKKELDEVKNRWKEELGIKRSPINFLMKESDTELVGEKSARLSEKLATIKRDIELDGLTLSDLEVSINRKLARKMTAALEFSSVHLNDYLNADIPDEDRSERINSLPFSFKASFNEEAMGDGVTLINNLEAKAERIVLEPEGFEAAFATPFDEECESESEKKEYNIIKLENKSDADKVFSEIKSEDNKASFIIDKNRFTVIADDNEYELERNFIFTGEIIRNYFAELVENKDIIFYTFDLKSELHEIFDGTGIEPVYNNIIDISLIHYLLNPLVTKHDLEDIETDYGNIPEGGYSDKAEAALSYGEKLLAELENKGMKRLFFDVEMPLVYTLFAMENRGIILQNEEIRAYSKELAESMEGYASRIYEEAGEEFNINSPKQLGTVLFDKLQLPYGKKTKTGYSTSADVLEKLRPIAPIVDDILNYRQVAKLKSTYTDGLEAYVREDGRVHTTYNQMITATGRLSSTEPNLQNIPVRVELGKKIRKAFVPATGHIFVDADYSQIELRIMAHMSGDPELIEAYKEAKDIHRITASKVFHVPFDEVTGEQRRNAKAVNFGIIYGISSFGLGENLNISRYAAEDFIKEYFRTFPRVKKYLDSLVARAKDTGYAETLFGRKRPIPELESNNGNMRKFGERVAMNAPIQGTAADIMKIAMNNVEKRLRADAPEAKLLLQIHDELLIEAPEEDKDEVGRILAEEMGKAVDLAVPLECEVTYGYDWYGVH